MTNNEVPPKPQRDVIREVDWLAVAPWLLIVRAAKAVVGWPLFFGAIGSVLLTNSVGVDRLIGPVTTANRQLIRYTFHSVHPSFALPLHSGGTPHLALEWWVYAGKLAAWLVLGLLVANFAANQFGDRPRLKTRARASQLWRQLKRVFGAIGLLAIIAAPFVAALATFSWFMADERLASWVGSLWGVVALGAGVPVTVVWFVAILAAPLVVAAVVVDDADPFDAVSRATAYALQRPVVLGWCALVAWCAGVAGGAIVEWLLMGVVMTMETLGAPSQLLFKHQSAAASWGFFEAAARGFYPAYVFTAGVAIYLVMRRQVDGQPIDEIS